MTNLNPHISVDCVIFGYDFETLNVLIIQRGVNELNGEPRMAIPGDLIRDDENLPSASERILHALTGLDDIYIEQVGAFGDPLRTQTPEDQMWLKSMRNDPEARVVTIAFYALVNMTELNLKPAYFAEEVYWCPISEVPNLAFDHNSIINTAYTHLQATLNTRPVGYNLLPEKFTLNQLQTLYEAILNKEIDKRNFRRKIKKLGIVEKLEEKETGVPHKPSRYFKFSMEKYDQLLEKELSDFGI